MRINFEHMDEAIPIIESKSNILVVENNKIYAKIIYSLYNREDEYFKIFDEKFKNIPEKSILTILNPIEFDFNNRNMKSIIYNHIANGMNSDIDIKESIELSYQEIVKQVLNYIDKNENIDFIYNTSIDMKDLFKLINLSISEDDVESVFEKIQRIIDVLNEFDNNKILIFANISTFLSKEEYGFVIEQINLNGQTVLLIENNQENLEEEIPYYYLDYDFYLSKMWYNKK